MKLQPYSGSGRESGVTGFAAGADFIVVEFRGGARYLYDHDTPGREHVEAMKALAATGEGLATYISQHVGSSYARKLG